MNLLYVSKIKPPIPQGPYCPGDDFMVSEKKLIFDGKNQYIRVFFIVFPIFIS